MAIKRREGGCGNSLLAAFYLTDLNAVVMAMMVIIMLMGYFTSVNSSWWLWLQWWELKCVLYCPHSHTYALYPSCSVCAWLLFYYFYYQHFNLVCMFKHHWRWCTFLNIAFNYTLNVHTVYSKLLKLHICLKNDDNLRTFICKYSFFVFDYRWSFVLYVILPPPPLTATKQAFSIIITLANTVINQLQSVILTIYLLLPLSTEWWAQNRQTNMYFISVSNVYHFKCKKCIKNKWWSWTSSSWLPAL